MNTKTKEINQTDIKKTKDRSHRRAVLGAVLTSLGGICWGVSGTLGQFLFTQREMSSRMLIPLRLLIAGIMILTYYFIRSPRRAVSVWHGKRNAFDMVIYGIFGITLCQFTYFTTIELSSASVATILQELNPALILIFLCIKDRMRPRAAEIISILLAVAGVFLITTHGDPSGLQISLPALLLGLVCAVSVTVYNVFPARFLNAFPTPLLQGWSFLMGGILLSIVFRPWEYTFIVDFASIAAFSAIIIIGNVVAFNLYMYGMKLINPKRASLYGFAEPVTAALLAAIWLKTTFTLYDLAGFVCIFAMIFLLSFSKREKHPN